MESAIAGRFVSSADPARLLRLIFAQVFGSAPAAFFLGQLVAIGWVVPDRGRPYDQGAIDQFLSKGGPVLGVMGGVPAGNLRLIGSRWEGGTLRR